MGSSGLVVVCWQRRWMRESVSGLVGGRAQVARLREVVVSSPFPPSPFDTALISPHPGYTGAVWCVRLGLNSPGLYPPSVPALGRAGGTAGIPRSWPVPPRCPLDWHLATWWPTPAPPQGEYHQSQAPLSPYPWRAGGRPLVHRHRVVSAAGAVGPWPVPPRRWHSGVRAGTAGTPRSWPVPPRRPLDWHLVLAWWPTPAPPQGEYHQSQAPLSPHPWRAGGWIGQDGVAHSVRKGVWRSSAVAACRLPCVFAPWRPAPAVAIPFACCVVAPSSPAVAGASPMLLCVERLRPGTWSRGSILEAVCEWRCFQVHSSRVPDLWGRSPRTSQKMGAHGLHLRRADASPWAAAKAEEWRFGRGCAAVRRRRPPRPLSGRPLVAGPGGGTPVLAVWPLPPPAGWPVPTATPLL